MMLNKKGISTVIATIALVTLSITAVAIVGGFLVPFIKERLVSTKCFSYRGYFYFEEDNGYNCYNKSSEGYYLYAISVGAHSVTERTNEEIKGFRLVLRTAGEATVVDVIKDSLQNSGGGGVRMLAGGTNIVLPNSGEVRTYVYNSTPPKNYSGAEIMPILKDRVCGDDKDSIKLKYSCEMLGLELS